MQTTRKKTCCMMLALIMLISLLVGVIPAYATETDTVVFDGHTYAYVEDDMSWTDARDYCEAKGGHLATVTSSLEQIFLENAFPSTSGWIGLFKDQEVWRWVTDEEIEYTNWDSGEPNNSGGDEWCVHIRSDEDMQWNDAENDDTYYHSGFYIEWEYADGEYDFIDFGNVAYFNGHKYAYFEGSSISWTDARALCQELGGHLMIITSADEQKFLEQQYPETSGWIGMYLDNITWRWVTNEKVEYTNWDSGEPNDAGGDECCVHIWSDEDMQWNDLNNEDSRFHYQSGFYCEWDDLKDTDHSDWAGKEIEEAEKEDLIPESLINKDLTLPINRLEFAGVAVKTYENLTGVKSLPVINNPFTDTDDLDVLKAYNIGITDGTSDTTFDPYTLLSREQCATMLTRVFKRAALAGWTLDTDSQFHLDYKMPSPFVDDSDISAWAKDSVYFMVANGIINGIGDNRFAPRNTTTEQEAQGYATATREQALAIAVRMVRNLK